MFDGKIGKRVVSFGGGRKESEIKSAKALSDESKRQREQRAVQKTRTDAAIRIQKIVRMRLTRKKSMNSFRALFDKKFNDIRNLKTVFVSKRAIFNVPLASIDSILQSFLFFYSESSDSNRLLLLTQLLIESIGHSSPEFNYLTSLATSCKWNVSLENYANIKLLRLKKLCTVSLKHFEITGDRASADLLIGVTALAAQAPASEQFLKTLMCCLLCEEAARGLTRITKRNFNVDLEVLLNVVRQCIIAPSLYPDSLDPSIPWNVVAFYRERVLKSVSALLLSIPSVSTHTSLTPILSLLTHPQYFDWSSLIQSLSVETKSSEASLHILGNVLSLFVHDKISPAEVFHSKLGGGDALLSSLSAVLNTSNTTLGASVRSNSTAVSLLSLLRNVDRFDPIPSVFEPTQLEEASREYSMSPGHRKLEYRLFAYQQQLCRKSDGGVTSSPAMIDSLKEVLKFLSNRQVVQSVFSRVSSEASVADVLSLCSLYGQTLLHCPASCPVTSVSSFTSGEGTSKSLLNSIIFHSASSSAAAAAAAAASENVVVRLWRLIVTHLQPILTLITVNFSNTFQEAVNTYNGAAISESSQWSPFFVLAASLGLKPAELFRQANLVLFLFCSVFTAQLTVLDDTDLHSAIPSALMEEIVMLLKGWLHNLYWLEPVFDDSKVSLQDMLRGVEVGNPPVPVTNKYGLNLNITAGAAPILSYKYLFLIRSQCQLVATRLFQQLCYRNERHIFMSAVCYQWPPLSQTDLVIVDPTAVIDSANSGSEDSSVGSMIAKNPKVMNVLTFIPQVMNFEQRVYIFQQLLDHDKVHYHGGSLRGMMGFNSVRATIRRDYLLEDSYATLNRIGHKLKGRIQIEFISSQGYTEAGIDGGGLFKEFLDCFCKAVFTPPTDQQQHGSASYFMPTFQQLLTINPEMASSTPGGAGSSPRGTSSSSSGAGSVRTTAAPIAAAAAARVASSDASAPMEVVDDEVSEEEEDEIEHVTHLRYTDQKAVPTASNLEYYHFIGKILGKACYDRILLESQFSGGLLNILLGRSNQLDDLAYLDEELYRSLRQLKKIANEGGDIESLDLYFVASRHNSNGTLVTVDLIPNGGNTLVTRATVHQYIHLLAHYKQNTQIAEAAKALVSGFRSVVPLEWIRMFSGLELQKLIGGERQRINIADLKMHCNYASGYAENQPYMQGFWSIVEDMSLEDQGHFLRFVTSCSRQPLLGFKMLNPLFCIQKVPAYEVTMGVEYDERGNVNVDKSGRLPTAATCMNLLKLPFYDNDLGVLKKKLLYAIRSNSGFELS